MSSNVTVRVGVLQDGVSGLQEAPKSRDSSASADLKQVRDYHGVRIMAAEGDNVQLLYMRHVERHRVPICRVFFR